MATAISIDRQKDYVTVKLPENLETAAYKEFELRIPELTGVHVIVSCVQHTFIPKDWLRLLLKIHLNLKPEGKSLKLVSVNNILLNYFKKEGVDAILGVCRDLPEALTELGCNHRKTMDTEFIDPFLTSAIHVLKVQASVDARAGKPALKKSGEVLSGDVSGIIGVISESFQGSVVITFPEKTFLKVMSSMLGEEFTELSQDILDGAGELTNIIFGQAKITLNNKGYGIQTAIPTVISGRNHSFTAQTKGPVVVIPFESSAGLFFVEICMN